MFMSELSQKNRITSASEAEREEQCVSLTDLAPIIQAVLLFADCIQVTEYKPK